jgi:hypothetical protein
MALVFGTQDCHTSYLCTCTYCTCTYCTCISLAEYSALVLWKHSDMFRFYMFRFRPSTLIICAKRSEYVFGSRWSRWPFSWQRRARLQSRVDTFPHPSTSTFPRPLVSSIARKNQLSWNTCSRSLNNNQQLKPWIWSFHKKVDGFKQTKVTNYVIFLILCQLLSPFVCTCVSIRSLSGFLAVSGLCMLGSDWRLRILLD